MQMLRNMFDFLNAEEPQEQGGLAQQILSARFQPTAQDVGNSALAGISKDAYVNPQDYADTRMQLAMKQLADTERMNHSRAAMQMDQQRVGLQERQFGLQERQFEEDIRHNRETERRLAETARLRAGGLSSPGSGPIPNFGKPPTGYRYKPDGTLEPIPGGPGEKIPSELAARVGLAKKTLGELPTIKEGVMRGEATGPIDYAIGAMGYDESGKLRRRIADGADAIQRMLTGAGMPASEAQDYVERFRTNWSDTDKILLDKLNNMEAVLQSQLSVALQGHGGFNPDTIQGFSPPTPEEEAEYMRLRGRR